MIKAYAAFEPGGKLQPFEYYPGALGDHDVEIAVEHCGICHSDLSMLHNDWGITQYPFVPGHEIIGTIAAKGAHVSNLSVGQRVGLGWHAGYCMTCHSCLSGDHNLCAQPESTIVGHHGVSPTKYAPKRPVLSHCPMASTHKTRVRCSVVELPFSIRCCNTTFPRPPRSPSSVLAA